MQQPNFADSTSFANLKNEFKKETGLNYNQDLKLYMEYIVSKKLDIMNNQLYVLNENLIKGIQKIR